jgi:7-cyano-7-deazaguanine synthase
VDTHIEERKAVIILSGGLDSTTCMGIARAAGYSLYPLTFDYGQRHRIELQNARAVADFYGVGEKLRVVSLDFLRAWGGSALTDEQIPVPQTFAAEETGIPVTYVPGRNLLFLSIAASYAEIIGAQVLYIGVNALDYSGYPDCRPEFISRMEEVLAFATKTGVEGRALEVAAPLIHMTKAQIISAGMQLGVPYQLTTSCYNGQSLACGKCDSCRLRLKGFADAGYADPIAYEQE